MSVFVSSISLGVTYFILCVNCHSFLLEELDDLNMTLSGCPVDGTVTMLKEIKKDISIYYGIWTNKIPFLGDNWS